MLFESDHCNAIMMKNEQLQKKKNQTININGKNINSTTEPHSHHEMLRDVDLIKQRNQSTAE